nr:uncharacterized protein LOC107453667 isoform X2 [Parasteatoda tepidariorum]
MHTKIQLYFSEEMSFLSSDISLKLCGTLGFFYLIIALATSIFQMLPLCRFYLSENEWFATLAYVTFLMSYICLFFGRENKFLQKFLMIAVMLLQAISTAYFVLLHNALGVLHSLGLTAFILLTVCFLTCLLQRCCNVFKIVILSILLAIPVAILLQVILACKIDELFTSFFITAFLISYYMYFSTVIVKKFPHLEYSCLLVYLYLWPLICFSYKL